MDIDLGKWNHISLPWIFEAIFGMIPLTKYDFQASGEQWGRDEIYDRWI